MAETYSFTAKVVVRREYRIGISPEDRDAFDDFLQRVGLPRISYWKRGTCLIWVNNRELLEAAIGADRVRYVVEKRLGRMFGVCLLPLK